MAAGRHDVGLATGARGVVGPADHRQHVARGWIEHDDARFERRVLAQLRDVRPHGRFEATLQ